MPNPTTPPPNLERLRELLERASAGPLTVTDNSWSISTVYDAAGNVFAECPIDGDVCEESQAQYEPIKEANALLITEAINALPSLLDLASVGRGGAIADIAAERSRQINAEGWTPEHDDKHTRNELADAAACYAHGEIIVDDADGDIWPWDDDWWKPKDRRHDLVRAAALIVAEIERLDRKSSSLKEITDAG